MEEEEDGYKKGRKLVGRGIQKKKKDLRKNNIEKVMKSSLIFNL